MSKKFNKIFKGRFVRTQIAANLFNALHEANLADAYDEEVPENENDLPHALSGQDSLFGHLAEAIKSLGFEKEYDFYCDSGERPAFCFKVEDVHPDKCADGTVPFWR